MPRKRKRVREPSQGPPEAQRRRLDGPQSARSVRGGVQAIEDDDCIDFRVRELHLDEEELASLKADYGSPERGQGYGRR